MFLGLVDFLAGELVHVITPIGATFLRQRAAHLRVGSTRPRGASSGVVPPLRSSTGAEMAEDLPCPRHSGTVMEEPTTAV